MSTVFALSARTGKAIWVDRDLLSQGQGTFGIQPEVANGRVYLASSIGTGPSGGVLLALQASTGKVLWRSIRSSTAAPVISAPAARGSPR